MIEEKKEGATFSPKGIMTKLFGPPPMATAGMPEPRKKEDPLEGVDIAVEYQLIQDKRSELTAYQRREVVKRMEKHRK